MKITPGSKKEYLITVILFGGVMFPLRLLIVNTVGNNWYGSFGILTTVTIALIILAKKNKLGFFGPMYIRFITRIHTAKWKIIAYSITGMFIITSGSVIMATNEGHHESAYWKHNLEQQIMSYGDPNQPIKEKILSKKFNITFDENNIPTDRQLVTALFGIVDDSSGGWFLHFYTILFIEQVEVAIMLILTRFAIVKFNTK